MKGYSGKGDPMISARGWNMIKRRQQTMGRSRNEKNKSMHISLVVHCGE